MINNRQQPGRRRRGRNPQGSGGRNEGGSRIDNRARGNAPQMLEKYKNLARDAQMQGDRVMTEYYLQFADHYFRIVAEGRARFEEQRRQRDDWQEDESQEGESLGDESNEQFADEPQDRPRTQRNDAPRNEASRNERQNSDRQPRDRNGNRRDYRNEGNGRGYEADRDEEAIEAAETVSIDILPPALGVTADPIPDIDEAPAPGRRGRPKRVAEAELEVES